MTNIALVIGAASNLGYQVLKRLHTVYDGKIYFTTDDEASGYKVLQNLDKNGTKLEYIQMDVTYTKSIIKLRHHIQDLNQRIDLIVNNNEYVTEKNLSHAELVRRTLSVNFYGNVNFANLVYPLLNENARVVNVSGPAGLLHTIENEDIKKRFSDPDLDEDGLVALVQEYEAAAIRGVEKTEGWAPNVQALSKVALNALTFLQHRVWSDRGVVINSVNPGNINKRDARKSNKVYEEGAKAILYLALEAPLSLKGNFVWSNYSPIEWNCDPFVEVSTV